MINKLNCMNYKFTIEDEFYYLQDGLRSLYAVSRKYKVNFKELCLKLYEKGFYQINNETFINMI